MIYKTKMKFNKGEVCGSLEITNVALYPFDRQCFSSSHCGRGEVGKCERHVWEKMQWWMKENIDSCHTVMNVLSLYHHASPLHKSCVSWTSAKLPRNAMANTCTSVAFEKEAAEFSVLGSKNWFSVFIAGIFLSTLGITNFVKLLKNYEN